MGTASQFRLRFPPEINTIQSRNWRLSPFFTSLLVVLLLGAAVASAQTVERATLTGRVIDDESGRPVANFRVSIVKTSYKSGNRIWSEATTVNTDGDGQFTVPGLVPGQYLIRISPKDGGTLFKRFSEEEARRVDTDYEESFWPGGGDVESAAPILLTPGASVNAGTLKPRKGPYYRAVVQFAPANCDDATTGLTLRKSTQTGLGGIVQDVVPCGKNVLIGNLREGPYSLTVYQAAGMGLITKGSAVFEIRGANTTVPISLGQGVDVEGRVTAPEASAKPALENLKISVTPLVTLVFADEGKPVSPDATGKFRIPNVRAAAQEISVSGVPAPFYVKEIRYNGVALTGKRASVNTSTPVETLDVVIDDQPGTIAGTITDNDKPASGHVVLVKWPVSGEDLFVTLKNETGDRDGKFQFTGLAPGEYRLAAVAQSDKSKLDEPRVLERLLGSAERVNVERGAVRNVGLKLADPAR